MSMLRQHNAHRSGAKTEAKRRFWRPARFAGVVAGACYAFFVRVKNQNTIAAIPPIDPRTEAWMNLSISLSSPTI